MFLHVEGIGKIQADKWVVRNVDFTQERFRKIAIAGETGSGKSTLLKMIAGLEHPDEGIALFEGAKIKSPLEVLLPGQPGIAYLSQHFELRANYHVWELLSYANQLADTEAQTLYRVCRIDHLLQRRVEQLSGGEKQRIALARLLVQSPRLLLLDEPFSNLDPIHRELLKKVLEEITGRLQITCILASHDPADTLGWADEILVMKGGEKRQQADPTTLYYHPADTYIAALFGPFALFPPAIAQQIQGAPVTREGLLFVRPEQIRLGRQGKQRPVTIENRVFNGMYHLLEVSLDQFRFPVKTTDGEWAKGDTAAVSLAEDYEPHYLL